MITEPTPVRSLMNAHGKDVHGSLPVPTSSHATTENIQVGPVLYYVDGVCLWNPLEFI